jgi:ribonuclease P protein component
MLQKKERIPRKKFNEIFTTSKILSRGSFFVVRGIKNTDFAVSVVVPKKIAKKATERNYIKRIMYFLISQKNKENKQKNLIIEGKYIIIFQKKPINFADLKKEFSTHTFV